MYTLKHYGRMGFILLHDFLIENDFTQYMSDRCVYILCSDMEKLILIVRVDDIVMASSSVQMAETVKSLLSKKFMKEDFGIISSFLGIEYVAEYQCIKLQQSKYILKY